MTGGDPSQYQEVERTEQMQGTRRRWAVQPDRVAPTSVDIVAAPVAVSAVPVDIVAAPVAVAAVSVDIARDDAAGEAEAVRSTDTVEAVAAAPQRLIAWAIPDVGSEPPPVLQAAAQQPVVQANPEPVVQANPEPVVAAQQPADLSSVFARLLERDKSWTHGSQRRTS
jgi:hypothetical protein